MRAYITLGAIYLVYAVFSASWAGTGLFISDIQSSLGISTFGAAWLTNIVSIAKIFGSLCASVIFARFGWRWGYVLGCGLISCGAFSSSYEMMLFGRFCMGFGSAVGVVALVSVVQAISARPKRAVAFNSTANTFGNFIGISFFGYFSDIYWQDLLVAFAALNGVLVVVFVLSFRAYDGALGASGARQAKFSSADTSASDTRQTKFTAQQTKFTKQMRAVVVFMIFAYIDAVLVLNVFFVYFPRMLGSMYFTSASDLSWFLNTVNLSIIICGVLGAMIRFNGALWLARAGLSAVIAGLFVLDGYAGALYLMGACFGLCYGVLFSRIFMLAASFDKSISARLMSVFWAFAYGALAVFSQSFAFILDASGFVWALGFLVCVHIVCICVLFARKDILRVIK